MRKGALLLALVFAVAATTTASAARKKPAADPTMEAQKNSSAFFSDMFHPWAPSATMAEPRARRTKKKKK